MHVISSPSPCATSCHGTLAATMTSSSPPSPASPGTCFPLGSPAIRNPTPSFPNALTNGCDTEAPSYSFTLSCIGVLAACLHCCTPSRAPVVSVSPSSTSMPASSLPSSATSFSSPITSLSRIFPLTQPSPTVWARQNPAGKPPLS